MTTVLIAAWKKAPGEPEYKTAVSWDVHYPGAFCGMPIQFDNRHQAERIANALSVAFQAGGEAKLGGLRRFIGVSP